MKLHEHLKGKKTHVKLLIHDDICGLIHRSELYLLHDIKRIMEDFKLSVPIVADCSMAKGNLAEKKGVDDIDAFIAEYSIPAEGITA